MKPYILISACLVGMKTRYDGESNNVDKLFNLVKEGKAIFACPEQLGGMSTPRTPSEIEFGKTAKSVLENKAKVMGKDGSDVTKQFVQGAYAVLDLCKRFGIKIAILKEKSPSCGSVKTYDGSFTGNKIPGQGVTARLLMDNNITVYSEENYPDNL